MPDGSQIAYRRKRRRQIDRRRRSGRVRAILVGLLIVFAVLSVASAAVGALVAAGYIEKLPSLSDVRARRLAENTEIYAGDNSLLGILANDQNRQAIRLGQMGRWLPQATVAIEDRRFYEHGGLDYQAILRAAAKDIAAGHVVEGGSTLTQQLVSNLYIAKAKTFDRKIREAWLADQLDGAWSKQRILQTYMNTVFYGNNAYGVEAAAQTYFGRHARELTLAQAAMIAGMPQSPTDYDPYAHPARAKARRQEVLNALLETGKISHRRWVKASNAPLHLHRGAIYGRTSEPLLLQYVRNKLSADPDFGAAAVRSGGLRVYTTFNPRMQNQALRAIRDVLRSPGDPAAALVAIRPQTGEILAMASTAQLHHTQFDFASQAKRQPGSTFKSIVLTAAVAQGIDPYTTVYRSTDGFVCDPSMSPWCPPLSPTPYIVHLAEPGGGSTMNLAQATVASNNVVFVQLGLDVTPPVVLQMAHKLGVQSKLQPIASTPLGSQLVTPLEMTSVYATLAAGGVYHRPHAIRQVRSSTGSVLASYPPKGERVIPDGVASVVTSILRDNVAHGTGTGAQLPDGRPQAGKTGTTTNETDAWFCGYTPDLATCVWIGWPDQSRPLGVVEGQYPVFGGTLPASIWRDFNEQALANVPPTDFPQPLTPVTYHSFSSIFTRSATPPPSTTATTKTTSTKPKNGVPPPQPAPGAGTGTGSGTGTGH